MLPGFQRRWSKDGVVEAKDVWPWPEFKKLLQKWHKKLTKVIGQLAIATPY
jgi:hypothetical protein